MGDSFEHATGVERWELEAKSKGNNVSESLKAFEMSSKKLYTFQDPFVMNMRVRGKGTKENPNIVQALDTYRMVGCSCAEDDTNVKWFWLFEDKPKRCQCGYWFKLEASDAPEKYKLPI